MDLYKELSGNNYSPLEDCLNKIRLHKEIILFGAGVSGKTISSWLKENHIVPKAFIDSNPNKIGLSIHGIEVCSKDLIPKLFKNAFIVISCGDYAVILNELEDIGIHRDQTLYIDPKWITQPEGLREFVDHNFLKLQEAFDLLEDDLSRHVFVNMLKYRISYDTKYIKEICSDWNTRYFDRQLIGSRKIEHYVDVGGYIGDTVDSFIDVFGTNYQNIYVFEPNKENVRQLKEHIQEKNYHNITVFLMGLSDKEEELSFDIRSDIATRIDKQGKEKIQCNKMDTVLSDKRIDLIKMDVEGAELSVLIGSKTLIKKYKPALAICVYHKPEDYYEIPILIKKIYPGYKLYFRQYELSDTETICYAIGE